MNEIMVSGRLWMKETDTKTFELTLIQKGTPINCGGIATVYLANAEGIVLTKEVEIVGGIINLTITKDDKLSKGVYDLEVFVEELEQTFPENYYLQLVINKSLLSR